MILGDDKNSNWARFPFKSGTFCWYKTMDKYLKKKIKNKNR